jgi:hypothetical protein
MTDTHITVILHVEDVDRLLRILYNGSRPPMVHTLVCGCGRSASLTRGDAAWLGWQVLPHPMCPHCLHPEPYPVAETRARYIRLAELILGKVA